MNWQLISLPIVAALIGWGTNVIAIKMLFWPRKPINIFGWSLVGVLPKRKAEIAHSIGQVLNDDLLPTDELIDAVNTWETRQKVTEIIVENLAVKIESFLPKFIANPVSSKLRNYLEELVRAEIETLFSQLATNIGLELQENKMLGKFVESKINSFDLYKLEELVLKVAKNELRYIEVFGAVIGFFIGIIQVLLLVLF